MLSFTFFFNYRFLCGKMEQFKKLIYDNHVNILKDNLNVYTKTKSPDCILYSQDGSKFKVYKEIFCQTSFQRKILSTATENCCRTLEILCPCTKEELELLVNFLYDGEINISNASVSRKFKENLIKIFGYPKELSLYDQGTGVNISSKNISSQSSKYIPSICKIKFGTGIEI